MRQGAGWLNALRWILVPLAVYIAWHVALFSGLMVLSWVETLCSPEEMVSGACAAGWYLVAERTIIAASVGFAAVLIVAAACAAAPSHKRRVLWITYLAGAVAATVLAFGLGAWIELAAALSAGMAGAVCLDRRLARASGSRPSAVD